MIKPKRSDDKFWANPHTFLDTLWYVENTLYVDYIENEVSLLEEDKLKHWEKIDTLENRVKELESLLKIEREDKSNEYF